MRVYYSETSYIDFPTATHWDSCCDDWVELYADDENIVAILNWKKVWLIRPLTDDEIAAKLGKVPVI